MKTKKNPSAYVMSLNVDDMSRVPRPCFCTDKCRELGYCPNSGYVPKRPYERDKPKPWRVGPYDDDMYPWEPRPLPTKPWRPPVRPDVPYPPVVRPPKWPIKPVPSIDETNPFVDLLKKLTEKSYGWICAICGKSNAPNVKECPCTAGKKEKKVNVLKEE